MRGLQRHTCPGVRRAAPCIERHALEIFRSRHHSSAGIGTAQTLCGGVTFLGTRLPSLGEIRAETIVHEPPADRRIHASIRRFVGSVSSKAAQLSTGQSRGGEVLSLAQVHRHLLPSVSHQKEHGAVRRVGNPFRQVGAFLDFLSSVGGSESFRRTLCHSRHPASSPDTPVGLCSKRHACKLGAGETNPERLSRTKFD